MKNIFINMRRFILLILIAGFFYNVNYSQIKWQKQTSGVTSLLAYVDFININKGLVVGDSGIILRTTDGGKNWTKINTSFPNDLSSVVFASENVAFASGSNGLIIKSIDGGLTWTSLNTSQSNVLYSVNSIDGSVGYSTGMNGIIIKTIDGGVTWNYVGSSDSHSYHVAMIDNNTVFISGRDGTLFKSINGGNSWNYCSINTYNLLAYVNFFDSQYGIVVGDYGTIFKTTDGGNTWIQKNANTSLYLNNVQFLDTNTAYVVGFNGLILKSTDKGETWNNDNSGVTDRLISISFPSKDIGYAVGLNGTILKLKNTPDTVKVNYCSYENQITLTATNGYTSYTWKDQTGVVIGNKKDITIQNPTDNSIIKVEMSAGGNSETLVYQILRYDISIDFTFNNNCNSNTVNFTNLSTTNKGTLTYSWDFGDGSTSTNQNPTHTFTSIGVHKVKLTIKNSDGVCGLSIEKDVETFVPSNVKVAGETTFCFGKQTIFTASGAINYKWSTGAISNSISVNTSGKYWLLGSSTTGLCKADTIFINVTELPDWQLNITGDSTLCEGESATLIASGAVSYEWNTGNKTSSINVNKTGNYTVTGTNSDGCVKTSSLKVFVSDYPSADFTFDPSILEHDKRIIMETATISATAQNDVQYTWDLGDGTIISGNPIQHSYNITEKDSVFVVTLTVVNKYGCESSSTQILNVTPFIPNVFTPNEDGINDTFVPHFDLKIYDRNGILLYSGTTGWDGTYNGKPMDSDTYFYYIIYKDANNLQHKVKGYVALIR